MSDTGLYFDGTEWRMAVDGEDRGSVQSFIAQAAPDVYERGHFVAEQRAISRARLGLPIERGVEPAGGDVNDYHDTETRTPGWFITYRERTD